MSENELWIWYTLIAMQDEYSQQDICNAWSLSKQTVNSIVLNMIKKGYVYLKMVPGSLWTDTAVLIKDSGMRTGLMWQLRKLSANL